MANNHRYIRFFAYMGIDDVPRVGGKNASLGEMFCDLSVQVVHVLNGFAITADAYRYMLDRAGVAPVLKEVLAGFDPAEGITT
jgi:pyruvate, water dikinase